MFVCFIYAFSMEQTHQSDLKLATVLRSQEMMQAGLCCPLLRSLLPQTSSYWYPSCLSERQGGWIPPLITDISVSALQLPQGVHASLPSFYIINIQEECFFPSLKTSAQWKLLQVFIFAFYIELAQQFQQPLFSLEQKGGRLRVYSLHGHGTLPKIWWTV